MQCPRCQHENLLAAKFCPECAHPAGVSAAPTTSAQFGSPESYTPKHLAEKILTSKAALEGERKQVTVLFADLKGSMELLADRDPEDARKILDPVIEHMMEAVHRYEGTVNQVMGDGIMALFGAPVAHEDHAVRACYAALRMQESVKKFADEVRRSHAAVVKIRVGLHSGEVVVRAIGSEQIVFGRSNTLRISMLFQDLTQQQAEEVWRPFFERVAAAPREFEFVSPPRIGAVSARRFWDTTFLSQAPGIVVADDRPNATVSNVFWAADAGKVGQFLHGYQSTWRPSALLQREAQERLGDAVFAATRHWEFGLHFNKGLGGAPAADVAAARDTAMNPAVLDAFALVMAGAEEQPSYPGIVGHEPDVPTARRRASAIAAARKEIRRLVPAAGSYVSESDFFEESWPRAYWGSNCERLLAVENRYDPDGLFVVHHGVGSERWSADGFTRLA